MNRIYPGKTIKDFKFRLKRPEAGKNTIQPGNDFIRFEEKDIHQSIVCRFEEQVKKNPQNTAIQGPQWNITYNQLNEMANRTARSITRLGKDRKQGAALLLDHGPDMVTGIMAALKAGMYYVPLDAKFPVQRLIYMLTDSETAVLLTNNAHLQLAENLVKEIGTDIGLLNLDTIDGTMSTDNPGIHCDPGEIAYILYTSGSTGTPKGLAQSHLYVVHLIYSFTNTIHMSKDDHITLLAPFIFSASVMDLFVGLLNGAALHLMDAKNETIPNLLQRMKSEKITIYHSVPTLFRRFARNIREGDEFPHLRLIYLAGEPMLRGDVELFKSRFPQHCLMANGMGCTEFNICRQYFLDKKTQVHSSVVPVGYRTPGVEIKILDDTGQPVDHNKVGEIAVISRFLPKGYWKRPDLTEGRFLPGPGGPDVKKFLTGDIGRMSLDGCLTHLGRKDYQVKIRGQRVELAEIENVLDNIEGIAKSVVVARQYQTGENYIAAYYVNAEKKEVDTNTLNSEIKKLLPDYMVPRVFIRLEEFLLTPSGKIDRNALPEPDASQLMGETEKEYIKPGNWLEEKLVFILSDILEIDQNMIGVDANFFSLGGNSLGAMDLAAEIHKELEVNVPLAKIFSNPTVQSLAEYIKEANIEKYISIQPVEKKEYYALAPAQLRLYILQQMDRENISYNMPFVLPLKGYPDVGKLEDTLNKIIMRHESLRISFRVVDEEPVQEVLNKVEFNLDCYDTEDQGPGAKGKDMIKSFVRPFDLSRAPLLRVGLIKENESNSILIVDIHHIITDGISQTLLTKEFRELSHGDELPPLAIHYKDYSQWLQSPVVKETFKKQEDYWLKEFQGEIPVLNIPIDSPRPKYRSFEGKRLRFNLGNENTEELKRLAIEEGTTLFMVLLSIFNIMLAKITGQEDIIVGTDVAGRRHADLANVIGMFVNMLALRNSPSPKKTFKGFLREVNEKTLKSFENQNYQFEDLVDRVLAHRDTQRTPIFDVVLSYLEIEENPGGNGQQEDEMGNRESYAYEFTTARFDLVLAAIKTPDRLFFNVEYSTGIFKRETIQRFISYFKEIISSVIQNPYATILEIEMVSKKEENLLLMGLTGEEINDEYVKDESQKLYDSSAAEFDF